MIARARGFAVLAFGGVSMVVYFVLSLPVMLVTGSGDLSIWFARHAWAPGGLRLGGVRVDVRRLAPLPEGPAIYVSNHASVLDPWALFVAIPRNVRYIAKAELFRIPVFGWYLRLARFVPVDRHNRARAIASLKQAAATVRSGVSLVAFPEGTRSRDGRIHGFKKGPFALAVEAGVPVVPVAIAGSGAITPKGRVECHPGTISVAIGAAVDPREFPDRDAMLREVRRRIIEQHLAIGGAGGDLAEAAAPDARERAG